MEKSEIKAKLKDKIIGRDKYFNSAVLASFIEIENKLHFVLQKRAKNIRQGGDISFPGGAHDENDKSFEFTAIRETTEELGIKPCDIDLYGKVGTLLMPAGVIVEVFLGRILCSLEEFEINKDEVEKILVVPLDFFKENKPKEEKLSIHISPHYMLDGEKIEFPYKRYNLGKMYHKPWKGREREVYIYDYNGEVIWGITADIIHEIINNIF